MTKPKAILFDLDDTILSFGGVSDQTWNQCCEAFARENNGTPGADEVRKSIEKYRKWYWSDPERHKAGRADIVAARRLIVRAAFQALGFCDCNLADQFADNYSKRQREGIHLFDHAIEALQMIQSLGIKMVLLTNGTSKEQRGKIERFRLGQYFDTILIEEEAGVGKPDTKAYTNALAALYLSPADVWMVGDNLVWDVSAPQKLGIFSVWNDYRKTGLPKESQVKPDMIVNSIHELPIALANL